MKISIREARVEDVTIMTNLSNQLGYQIEIEQTKERLMHILTHQDNCVFVALEGELVIGWSHGFYTLRVESAPFVEIGGLVIDENYRRNGIGSMLVDKVIDLSLIHI